VRRKIYFVQPTYRDPAGRLHRGEKLFYASLALPALSSTVPDDWEKSFCLEYFEEVDFETDAPVVGITTMGYDLLHGREIAAEFKRRGRTVIMGGPQAHFSATRLRDVCDAVVHGHPDREDMAGLLADAAAGRLKPEYRFGMDVDFPFDYSPFDSRKIMFMPLLGSIGCRNHCSFCCTGALYRGRFHLRDIDCVLADIRTFHDRNRHACFDDPNIYNDREHLIELCRRMDAEGFELRWGAQCTLDAADDPAALAALHRAGCRFLMVGLESLDQGSLDAVGKQLRAERHRERLRRIRGAGIAVGGYFVLGLDGDTRSTFDELRKFIDTSGIAVPILNILIPAPGTHLYDQLARAGRLLIHDEEELLRNNARYSIAGSHCFHEPIGMSARELESRFLDLYGCLCSWPRILRRSAVGDLELAATLLFMNRELRKGYRAMRRERAANPP
jgi:radical SAM superfamily enzyme YgiQ (UPF0313 family)